MAEHATEKKKTSSSTIPDWTKLPEELLEFISKKMNCFDVVHARSVCTSWRSTFPFPSCLFRSTYSLPTYPVEKEGLCSIEKIPFILFRVPGPTDDDAASASEYFMGLLGRDESADYKEDPSVLQCSVRVRMARSDPRLMNMISCQIFSLGHQYRIICWDPNGMRTTYTNAAILPLNKDGGREGGGGGFIVLRSFYGTLLALTSAERRWVRLMGVPSSLCTSLVTFRGRFYANFSEGVIYVINPYLLEATCMMPPKHLQVIEDHLIACGNEELFLVKRPPGSLTCNVSRLDEESGGWVEVTDLGDRVLFVGENANVYCSANQLPDGCGVTGNSILFTNMESNVTYFYKYGPPKVAKENMASEWRSSREKRVIFLKSQALAFRVKR